MSNRKMKLFTLITLLMLTVLATNVVCAVTIDDQADTSITDVNDNTAQPKDITDNSVNKDNNLKENTIDKDISKEKIDSPKKETQTPTTITLNNLTGEYITDSPIEITGQLETPYPNAIFGVDIYVDDQKVDRVFTFNSGMFQSFYNTSTSGNHTVRAEFVGSDTLLPSISDTLTFNVKKYTNILVFVDEATTDENLIIRGVLYTQEYLPMIDVPVDLYINNEKIVTLMTNASASYQYSYSITRPGVYTATVKYEGNDIYAPVANTSVPYTVKYNTSLTIEHTDIINVSNAVHITGQFSSEYSPSLERFPIDIYVDNDKIDTVYTFENGRYESYYVPDRAGQYNIRAEYAGDNLYKASRSNDGELRAYYSFTITLDNVESSCIINEPVKIRGRLTSGGSPNYSSYNVVLLVNNEGETLLPIDGYGEFEYDYTPEQIGNYSVHILFEGSYMAYTARSNTVTFNVYHPLSLTLYHLNETYSNLDTVTIIADVTTENEREEDIDVDIYVNNEKIASQTCGAEGTITYSYTPQQPGSYNITLKYSGDNVYASSISNTETFNVYYYTTITMNTLDYGYDINDNILLEGEITSTQPNPGDGFTLDVYIYDEKVAIINTTSDGRFNYTLPPIEYGTYTIHIEYAGSDTTLGSNSSAQIFKIGRNSSIKLNELEDTYPIQTSILLEGKITIDNASSLSNLQIKIYLNDDLRVITYTNEEGLFYWTYAPSEFGHNIIRVEHEGDYVTHASVAIREFDAKYNSSITLHNLNETYNLSDTVPIISDLNLQTIEELEGISIDLYINDERVDNPNTDIYGMTRYIFTPPAAGNYSIVAKYDGNAELMPANASATLTIISSTEIIMDTPTTIKQGQTATITGKLVDANTNPIANQTIELSLDGNVIESTSTDSEGKFTFNTTPTSSGCITYQVQYQQTAYYHNTSKLVEVNVEEIVKPELVVDITNADYGEKVNIMAKIMINTNIMTDINSGKVVFKIDGKTLKDANGKIIYAKVVNGTATIENYTIPDSWMNEITLTAVYSGSSQCEKLDTQTNIIITSDEPTLTITPITEEVQKNTSIAINAKVQAGDNPITTGKIVFKLNGKTLKDANGKVIYAKIDSNGEVSFDYNIGSLKAGTYTLEATLISSNYDKITSNTTITVV